MGAAAFTDTDSPHLIEVIAEAVLCPKTGLKPCLTLMTIVPTQG